MPCVDKRASSSYGNVHHEATAGWGIIGETTKRYRSPVAEVLGVLRHDENFSAHIMAFQRVKSRRSGHKTGVRQITR